MLPRSVILLAAFLLLPAFPASAQQAGDIDFVVTFNEDGSVEYDGPAALLTATGSDKGERYTWELLLAKNYTVGEFRGKGAFDVERARQVVPKLFIDGNETLCGQQRTRGFCEYPLFEWVPREAVWDVDGPARIYNVTGSPESFVFRIGLPGAGAFDQEGALRATLVVERDVTPPSYDLGEIQNLTHKDLYRESTTEELALGDMQVRRVGSEEWVQNPTTIYHFLQRFPVQGFDPDTEYESRTVFTDWAGNVNTTPLETFRTLPKPVVPTPVITPLSPAPNATLSRLDVVIVQARIESPESPVLEGGVRLFYDLKEINGNFTVENGVLSFTPPTMTDGLHTVSVEVTNEVGGMAMKRWTFTVGESTQQSTPGVPLALLLVVLAGVALRRR